MTAPLRERLEDLLTRLDSPADRTLVQAAIRELAEREKDAEKLARYIVQHLCHLVAPDYACKQCAPNAEYLIEGFVCGYHRAVAIDAAIKEGK